MTQVTKPFYGLSKSFQPLIRDYEADGRRYRLTRFADGSKRVDCLDDDQGQDIVPLAAAAALEIIESAKTGPEIIRSTPDNNVEGDSYGGRQSQPAHEAQRSNVYAKKAKR
jgi:hypothetical protein